MVNREYNFPSGLPFYLKGWHTFFLLSVLFGPAQQYVTAQFFFRPIDY